MDDNLYAVGFGAIPSRVNCIALGAMAITYPTGAFPAGGPAAIRVLYYMDIAFLAHLNISYR